MHIQTSRIKDFKPIIIRFQGFCMMSEFLYLVNVIALHESDTTKKTVRNTKLYFNIPRNMWYNNFKKLYLHYINMWSVWLMCTKWPQTCSRHLCNLKPHLQACNKEHWLWWDATKHIIHKKIKHESSPKTAKSRVFSW